MEPLSEDVEFLEHFGVKGMKWGVRKGRTEGVSRRTDREASKDAEEFARAKMFYGKGAGTRRKLIRESVEAKSKKDPSYKKAFDNHLARQDMSVHASKARTERSRKDRKEGAKQTVGYLARRHTGQMGTKAAFTALAVGGATYLNSSHGRATMSKAVKSVKSYANSQQAKKTQDFLVNYFKKNS